MKTAILQLADQGPAESTALMLQAAGYAVFLPDARLRAELRAAGCDLVLSPRDLSAGMGYDPVALPEIGPEAMDCCDLYCDVKAHRCCPKVVARWPRLAGKVLWTRINGGSPEHVVRRDVAGAVVEDCGDEVNPPCPVLTPNLWYALDEIPCRVCGGRTLVEGKAAWMAGQPMPQCDGCDGWGRTRSPWAGRAYACWPPFARRGEYSRSRIRPDRHFRGFDDPICLVHNLHGWGYGALAPEARKLGVKCHGAGSPDGLVRHKDVPYRLSSALAMVHLKSSDAPGYALYEALAAACPLVVPRRLIWRNRMQDLFVPGETCLVFDRETHDALSPGDVALCTREIKEALARLRDPAENRRLGEAGRARLDELMWREDRDGESLREFFARNFP